MNSRTLKLLTASTAFVAVAASGNAASISTTVTAPVFTSASTPVSVTSTGFLNVTGSAAIIISSTNAASNTINVSTGGRINSSVSTTILSDNAANNLITINNSGTIANISSGLVIDTTGVSSGTTIRNAGTLTGGVTLGNGLNTIVNSGTISSTVNLGNGQNDFTSTGTTRGAITGGNTADNFSFTGATHTGLLDLGTGVNSLNVSNSTITGNIAGGVGADTFNISNSTITGNIELSSGTDVVRLDNSRVNGNISSSLGNVGGNTTLTLTNAIVSGTISDGSNNDSDVLNINGTNTFTTMGTIDGYEAVNINTNTALNHSVSGVTDLSVKAGTILTTGPTATFGTANLINNGTTNVNANTNMTGGLTNTGTVNIAAGKTLQAATVSSTGGTIGFGLLSSNTTTGIGKLAITGGTLTSSTGIKINVGSTSNYINSGTQYVIVSGASGTASNTTLAEANTGVYRFKTAVSGSDIVLTVGRVSTSSVVTGSDNKAVGAALDKIGTASKGTLATVQSVIGQQTTAAGVENVLESLTPSIDGAGLASVNVTVDTGNQISNRLASVRSTSGVATGDALASQHMWVQGFGSTVKQDDKGGNSGYDASAGGMSIGVDTDTLVDGFTTGLAFSYGRGKVDSNASSNASTDIDSYIATVYASQVLDSGVFLNGQIAGGYNKYDMTRNIIGVGTSKGDTDAFQGSAKLEAGKDFAAGGFTLTPLASLQYTYLDMDKYTETGAGGASLTVDPEALSTVDAGAGGQVAYAIPLADGATLKPSAHAKYIYRMGDTEMGTTSSFTGGTGTFNTSGVKADRASVNLGAGLLLTTVGGTDLSLNYDADIRSNLTGHTGQLKARWAF